MIYRSKQCRCKSDCSKRSSMTDVCSICHSSSIYWKQLKSLAIHRGPVKTYQTMPMHRLIWVFAGYMVKSIFSHVAEMWAGAQQNLQIACRPSKDLTLPGWSVFAVCLKKAWVLSYPLSAQQRLIRLGRCPGWSESLLGAHAILLVLSCAG